MWGSTWCVESLGVDAEHALTDSSGYTLQVDAAPCLEPFADDLRIAIWTTTPWTIPANVAVAVNADLEYVPCPSYYNRCRSPA